MPEIQNPNQQAPGGPGRDSSSLFTFFALFLAVFLGLQYYRQKVAPQPAPPSAANHAAAPALAGGAGLNSPPPQASTTVAAAAPGSVQAASEQSITVDSPLYSITLSNRGAQATHWVLTKYKDDDQKRPLDLVNSKSAAAFGYPLSLWSYDAGLRSQLAQALFVAEGVPAGTTHLSAPATVTFHYAAGSLDITKTLHFDNSYVVHASVTATRNGAPVDLKLAWPAALGDQNTLPQYAAGSINTLVGDKAEQLPAKKISGGETLTGNYGWAGISDLYFAAVFLPDHQAGTALVTLHNTVDLPRNIKKPDGQLDHASVLGVALSSAGSPTFDTRLFAGPKALEVLSAVHPAGGGPSMEKVVSFGWWAVISKPLFLLLHWFHEHIARNWGWDILILTLLLNVLMLPTRVMMMRSSLKMQRIQPEMDRIKAKYAKYKTTDPRRQEMNKEVFDLQRKEGVNMFGGCLPMLLQWPLLFGFYRMLSNVIELRQAHWLWLPDLAAPDPLHILPIFFIVSMFAVQYLTPSPGVDQQQQRMMAFTMPAVFGFMTWNIGSGLALYWACSNILGIGQQYAINQTSLGREMRSLAAKRASKRATGGGGQGRIINARR